VRKRGCSDPDRGPRACGVACCVEGFIHSLQVEQLCVKAVPRQDVLRVCIHRFAVRCDSGHRRDPGVNSAVERSTSQQCHELLFRKSRITDDASQRMWVDGIMPWDSDNSDAIRHHDVLTLSSDAEARFLQRSDRPQMRDACDPSHVYAGTSTSRSSRSPASWRATAIYSWMASLMLERASSSVFPCDQQPGRPGHETL